MKMNTGEEKSNCIYKSSKRSFLDKEDDSRARLGIVFILVDNFDWRCLAENDCCSRRKFSIEPN